MKRRKKKVVPSLIDSKLLNTKVPDKIITAEKEEACCFTRSGKK